MTVPDRTTFESAYAGKPLGTSAGRSGRSSRSPIGSRAKSSTPAAERGRTPSTSPGGHHVLGIDYLEGPVQEAEAEGQDRGLDGDVRRDGRPDAGDLFAEFRQRDRQRPVPRLRRRGPAALRRRAGPRHQAGRPAVSAVLQRRGARHPGAEAGHARGDPGLLCGGWAVEEIRPARFEVRPDLEGISFSEGGPRAWFSVIRREG